MRIFVGCDHAAFEVKEHMLQYLTGKGHIVEDLGTYTDGRCDYPDYAAAVAKRVGAGEGQGVLLCGSGIGVSMVANRYSGCRAALCRTANDAELSRQHNDSNILCVGARLNTLEEIRAIADCWLETQFEGGRHTGRVGKFNLLGEKEFPISEWPEGLERIFGIILGVFVVVSSLAGRFNSHYFQDYLAREDGILEYLSVVAIVGCLVLCMKRLKKGWGSLPWPSLGMLGLMILAFIFGAGEEMNWGQRIFGFGSPEFFQGANAQGEMNLHNLKFGDVKINKVVFGTGLGICIGIYFLILPFLYRKYDWAKSLATTLVFPIPKYWHIAAYLLLVIFATASGNAKKGEILEFGGTWIVFLMFLWPINQKELPKY